MENHKVELWNDMAAIKSLEGILLLVDGEGRWAFAYRERLLNVKGGMSCREYGQRLMYPPSELHRNDQVRVFATIMGAAGWALDSHNCPETVSGIAVVGRIQEQGGFDLNGSMMTVQPDGVIRFEHDNHGMFEEKFSEAFSPLYFHQLLENLCDLLALVGIKFRHMADNEQASVFLLSDPKSGSPAG